MRDGQIAAELSAAELDRDNALVHESLLLEPVSSRPALRGRAETGATR
jgi:hypothetical protein